MKTHSEQFLKRRKFLMVLPLLVLPFVTLAFWALGGGQEEKEIPGQQEGLNKEMPAAKLSGEVLDKMSLYNQAGRDSLESKVSDPFAQGDSLLGKCSGRYEEQDYSASGSGYNQTGYTDPNEAKVRAKLAELERALSASEKGKYPDNDYGPGTDKLARLEAMMQAAGQGNPADPEMEQLQQMLQSLMELQNPGLAQQRLKDASQKNRGRVYILGRVPERTEAAILKAESAVNGQYKVLPTGTSSGSFYDLEPSALRDDSVQQIAVPAVIHGTQTLLSGATVKMRLTEPVMINGVLIPSGTFISGTCSMGTERLAIEIANIRYGNNLYPVSLTVYDLDGIEGIHIPGAISRDAAKEGSDRALQSMQLMTLDPSIGAQAAGAGVEAVKGLFGKKAKLVRVTVKSGHPILLMDLKAKQENN